MTLYELDEAVSDQGRIDQEYLRAYGYVIGRRQQKRLREGGAEEPKRPGRPRIVDNEELLDKAREILAKHSKAGSSVVRGRKTEHGWRKVRGGGKDAREDVASESLLATPGTIYNAEPDIHGKISESSWRKLLKEHFGQFRLAARKTDICSHCDTYHKKVVPAFRKLLAKAREASWLRTGRP